MSFEIREGASEAALAEKVSVCPVSYTASYVHWLMLTTDCQCKIIVPSSG